MMLDFHTHNQKAQAGTAIVNLPVQILLETNLFQPEEGGKYSVGIHPWWLDGSYDEERLWKGVETMAQHLQVVAIGECGLDRLKENISLQTAYFEKHALLAEKLHKPLIIHCVRAFDEILTTKKLLKPTVQWTIHGFRGKPQQAEQLLRAGFTLSFGIKANPSTVRLVPKNQRLFETDDENITINEVIAKFSNVDK